MAKRTIDYLQDIHKEVLARIDSREELNGLGWLDPEIDPLDFMAVNVERKAHAIRFASTLGKVKGYETELEDASLDLLGYAYLLHCRIKLLRNKEA